MLCQPRLVQDTNASTFCLLFAILFHHGWNPSDVPKWHTPTLQQEKYDVTVLPGRTRDHFVIAFRKRCPRFER